MPVVALLKGERLGTASLNEDPVSCAVRATQLPSLVPESQLDWDMLSGGAGNTQAGYRV